MRTVQLIGVPAPAPPSPDADAVVIALKSRTIPARGGGGAEPRRARLAAARRRAADLFQVLLDLRFDPKGNIGPVADALLDALGSDFTLFCPAFPEAGRTIYKGYLFVGDVLLSESGMRDHPLTPMRDPSLVRVLQRQTPGQVGLVRTTRWRRAPAAIRDAFAALRAGRHSASRSSMRSPTPTSRRSARLLPICR